MLSLTSESLSPSLRQSQYIIRETGLLRDTLQDLHFKLNGTLLLLPWFAYILELSLQPLTLLWFLLGQGHNRVSEVVLREGRAGEFVGRGAALETAGGQLPDALVLAGEGCGV